MLTRMAVNIRVYKSTDMMSLCTGHLQTICSITFTCMKCGCVVAEGHESMHSSTGTISWYVSMYVYAYVMYVMYVCQYVCVCVMYVCVYIVHRHTENRQTDITKDSIKTWGKGDWCIHAGRRQTHRHTEKRQTGERQTKRHKYRQIDRIKIQLLYTEESMHTDRRKSRQIQTDRQTAQKLFCQLATCTCLHMYT